MVGAKKKKKAGEHQTTIPPHCSIIWKYYSHIIVKLEDLLAGGLSGLLT